METAGSEQTSSVIMLCAKRVCTYVVGGRVGMNDTCYFTFDLKKLDHPPTPHMKGVLSVAHSLAYQGEHTRYHERALSMQLRLPHTNWWKQQVVLPHHWAEDGGWWL